jgi:aromatic ring hydroxylase
LAWLNLSIEFLRWLKYRCTQGLVKIMRSAADYLGSLQDGRTVYYRGERVRDITSHPVLKIPVQHSARLFSLRDTDSLRKELVVTDRQLGDISGFFLIPTSSSDLLYRSKIIALSTRASGGVFNITQVIGSDALFALSIVAKRMAKESAERVQSLWRRAAKEDLALAVAQTDVKGDRSKRPHEQRERDMYLRVVERRSDGIVVRGAKAHTTQSITSNEIVVLPSRSLTAADRDYAVAFSVPANAKGLKLIVRPMLEIEGLPTQKDAPVSSRDAEAESLTIFDDVFVPADRVFLDGDWKLAGELANLFALYHRFTAISYRPVTCDLYIGAARLAAKSNGITEKSHVKDALLDMVLYREYMEMAATAACHASRLDSISGVAIPNELYTNLGKLNSNAAFHEFISRLVDIAGGLVSTLPGSEDLDNKEESEYILKYLEGSEETLGDRYRIMRLVRELVGGPFTGYMLGWMTHAEGSVQASKIAMLRAYDFTGAEELAVRAAGIGAVNEREGKTKRGQADRAKSE